MYKEQLVTVLLGSLLLVGCSSGIQRDLPIVEQAVSNYVLEVRVSASSDDAEESATGGVTRSSTTLELVRGSTNQIVGLRFTGLTIPSGATITNSYIQFSAKTSNSEATSLTIQGQAVDDPATFSGSTYGVSSRARTTASVPWTPAAWTLGTAGSAQRTPSLTAILQEIVSKPGWASGDALALLMTGTGRRGASSYDASPADAPLLHVEYSLDPTPIVETRIAASTDDAEESASGGVSRLDSALELVRASTNQTVGLRFTGVTLPPNATVTNAYIQFKAKSTNSEVTDLTVQGQATDDPVSFSGSLYNVSARARTTASVAWSPAAWTLGAAGSAQRTPNLASIIQEIVGRPGWSSGNALAFIVTGTGRRVALPYDGSQADAPLLRIEYKETNTPPSVDGFAARPNVVERDQSVALSWSVSDSDGDPLSCTLDVDSDGASEYTVGDCRAMISQAHLYTASGSYTATLTVTDSDGVSAAATTTVEVADDVPSSVTVATVGDIACDPASASFNNGEGTSVACRQKYVADVVTAINPDAVLVLGDLQYNSATYANFMASYDLSWGLHKDKTLPVIGNHEGEQLGSGTGYCRYFGQAAHCNANGTQDGAAYYSFDLGEWHFIALNSNCAAAGGCDTSSPQYEWLLADLAAHPSKCTLVYWHHPRFSSGNHGNHTRMDDIFSALYDAGVEVVLSGHDHNYERFAPQTPDGEADPKGVQQFVVGTGGKNFYTVNALRPNSKIVNYETFGVLKLTLHPESYNWEFVPEAGETFTDRGTDVCY